MHCEPVLVKYLTDSNIKVNSICCGGYFIIIVIVINYIRFHTIAQTENKQLFIWGGIGGQSYLLPTPLKEFENKSIVSIKSTMSHTIITTNELGYEFRKSKFYKKISKDAFYMSLSAYELCR